MKTSAPNKRRLTVEIEASWTREVDERVCQIDMGEVELLDGEAVMREMRALARKRR